MSADSSTAHLTAQSPLPPAIRAWEMYLNDQGRSPNTVKAFLSDVRILTQFLPPDQALGAITTKDLNRYFEWMEKERPVPCSPKTLARRITSTKSFFRWLHQYGVLLVDPAEKVLQRSVMSPLPTVLTEAEVQAVLQAADRHRHERKAGCAPVCAGLLAAGDRHQEERVPGHPSQPHRPGSARRPAGLHPLCQPGQPLQGTQDSPARRLDPGLQGIHGPVPARGPALPLVTAPVGIPAGRHRRRSRARQASLLRHVPLDQHPDGLSRRYGNGKIRQKLGVSKIQWREINLKLRQLSEK